MASRHDAAAFAVIEMDRSSKVPLHRQLYDELRDAILTRRLKAGARLPSTRALAAELHVSRNTVMTAFEQLLAEGYLEGKTGAGTFVARALPDEFLQVNTKISRSHRPSPKGRTLSEKGALLTALQTRVTPDGKKTRAFQDGLPAIDEFPMDLWGRIVRKRLRHCPPDLLSYGNPAGYRPLREAIADYLAVTRAVRCSADQIIIVAGSQQGLDLIGRMLLDPGDAVWIEDPGYRGARGALMGAGARLFPIPIDNEGLDVDAGKRLCPNARLAYVSPSHQYPLGVVMSLSRRLALLEWASRSWAWILEDDYDSEFRYKGRPLAALQGLDGDGRVIYAGTFSKVLFPSLRLGYLVVPSDLVETFSLARLFTSYHAPSFEQAVVADFISEGHFARHVRRMRAIYKERQESLFEAAAKELDGLLEVRQAEAGMHLIGWLPEGVDDCEASTRAAARGIDAPPLSYFCIEANMRGGLLLGYTGLNPKEIGSAVRLLAAALREPNVKKR